MPERIRGELERVSEIGFRMFVAYCQWVAVKSRLHRVSLKLRLVACESLVTGVFLVAACTSANIPTATTTPFESSWYACLTFIQQQYNITDAERYNPSKISDDGKGLYTVTIFYPQERLSLTCSLYQSDDSNWHLLHLQ